ncbi:Ribosomal large subunit pseudouridine synthase B [Caenispirillum salinarum AK4]|uniref:Pseudouridine synthase n=1 Tax=Caenispirillum salinarum AK4 TaxID=1238182 RepID=K9H1N7_9PROT|nr:pseudouridine synthase [Caenispirillum salinarum]EKV32130.1 Ribosomal large subunit pseudouridine synthase B [Caenispirillum salinarum AK4]
MTDDRPDDTPAPGPDAAPEAEKGERIAKYLARAGLCSRRDAERLIGEGRVRVNGKKLDTPAVLVTGDEQIVVDGKPVLAPEPPRLWRYHKPAGVVTTHKDPEGRPTVFDKVADRLPRVISVGRLDINSEGLLLLTNDGELARKLEHPSQGWVRRYRVRVHGIVKPETLATLERGVTVEGVKYGSIHAVLDRQTGTNAWVTVSLKEGKNREVRRVMEHLGYTVTRLIRISYGPFHLGMLERGAVEEVPTRVLKDQLGRGPGEQKEGRPKKNSADTTGRAVAKPRKVRPGARKKAAAARGKGREG